VRLSAVSHSPSIASASSAARSIFRLCRAAGTLLPLVAAGAFASPAEIAFTERIEPLLKKHCYDCHGDGLQKGGVAFDDFASTAEAVASHSLWLAVLKNVRAGIMPPHEEGAPRPTDEEISELANWIKYQSFQIDPANPDPGRVTVRRLNRIEYRNTIRDLMGIDFNSEAEFPPDDSGGGFDNNGNVLTVSPLLLEKYLAAAEVIVDRAVPKVAKVIREHVATGRDFRRDRGPGTGEVLSAKTPARVSRTFKVERDDRYQVSIEVEVRGSFDFDPARCRVTCRIDGEETFVEQVGWQERKILRYDYELPWRAGDHVVSFEIEPLPPADYPTKANAAATPPGQSPTRVDVRIASVRVRGPLSPEHWTAPENHARFFPAGAAPEAGPARDGYAADVLRQFATRAFRRPIDEGRLAQLVAIAREVYTRREATFELGIARAMMAVLASPRFLFRVEDIEPGPAGGRFPLVDEHALASRLSYFFWSTMPDEELFRLAARGELRRNLRAQVDRMLADARAQQFVRNFTGQWLQARDVESVPINARIVLGPDAPRNRDGRVDFDGAFRRLMRSETEMYFEHIIREDRSVLELIDSDYTFLNDRLAVHYGVPGVTGEHLRKVHLPPDSPRGGVLTQGTVLTVTSNPTRTSPVKRGLFILDHILGTPPPPAPPDVPDLEEARKEFKDREPKLSEMLAAHRSNKLCYSCHARMDPLGLAFENFNAMGGWRDTEARQPIDPSGQLITGEPFADVRELKRILSHERRVDFYRCLTEKLLTYALGRGLEPHDTHTVDTIVDRLRQENGRMSVLLTGVIESVPFQRQRNDAAVSAVAPPTSSAVARTELTP
jgi:mono/diheme cytochrome c family protein